MTVCFQAICLLPKPPPMYCLITRTWCSGSPSFSATCWRTSKMDWVESHRVRRSPSQATYSRGAPGSCAARSGWCRPRLRSPRPRAVRPRVAPLVDLRLAGQVARSMQRGASGRSAASRSTTKGRASYSTSIRRSASAAISSASAATAATSSPTKRTVDRTAGCPGTRRSPGRWPRRGRRARRASARPARCRCAGCGRGGWGLRSTRA